MVYYSNSSNTSNTSNNHVDNFNMNNNNIKHKRFYDCSSPASGKNVVVEKKSLKSSLSNAVTCTAFTSITDTPKLSRARKVSTEADIVVSFVKSRCLPCSSFEKKFYLKRNSDIVEERICYNTRFEVRNRREFLKTLKLVTDVTDGCDDPSFFLEKALAKGCINEAPCSSFSRSNLVNVISGGSDPLRNNNNNNTISSNNTVTAFALKSVSYDAFSNKYTDSENNYNTSESVTSKLSQKLSTLRHVVCSSSQSSAKKERKIGDLYFEYRNECNQSVSFYVIVACYEKAPLYSKPSSLKCNTKQRLKKMLLNCAQDIRKYTDTPNEGICSIGHDVKGTIMNQMQELLELDITNWKVLDYKFKSSKDESFYKQIRRRNKTLTEV